MRKSFGWIVIVVVAVVVITAVMSWCCGVVLEDVHLYSDEEGGKDGQVGSGKGREGERRRKKARIWKQERDFVLGRTLVGR